MLIIRREIKGIILRNHLFSLEILERWTHLQSRRCSHLSIMFCVFINIQLCKNPSSLLVSLSLSACLHVFFILVDYVNLKIFLPFDCILFQQCIFKYNKAVTRSVTEWFDSWIIRSILLCYHEDLPLLFIRIFIVTTSW